MRVFFAVPIHNSLWLQIHNNLEQLKQFYQHFPIHWTHRDNLHITLQFIHALDSTRLAKLLEDVSNNIATIQPFKIALENIVMFPSSINPRAIALQVTPNEKLHELALSIGEATALHGITADKRSFRAHMTIARTRNIKKLPFDPKFNTLYGDDTVGTVTLYVSKPQKHGSRYVPIADISLGNT